MKRTRLEAFSDGVLAIVITIMVLELKAPHGDDLHSLAGLAPVFYAYVLSFVNVAIYWNNHHHLMHMCEEVDGRILWANTHLLFWLSLVPFTTAWMEESNFAPVPTAVYGGVLLASAFAYYLLQLSILARHGPQSRLRAAIGADLKGKLSPVCYILAIPMALFVSPLVAQALYIAVGAMWLIPDRRISRALARE